MGRQIRSDYSHAITTRTAEDSNTFVMEIYEDMDDSGPLIEFFRLFFQHALFLNDSGRSEEAFQLMKQTADAGHTRAQFNTGVFYAQGHGVKQDYGMAVIYYSMAAMLGDRDANYNLGLLFYLGKGVEQPDYNKAVSYYTTAALLGDYLAMAALSYCYRNGKGVEKDEEEAAKWTKEALNTPGSNMFSVMKVWEIMDSGNPSNISYSE